VGDWGVAIILLTVVIRLALMPLTIKQTKSMYEMQRVQPKLKELQERYKDDKEKQQEEVMKFYQENKVNPFGGCLPSILQMPFFFALYQVLGRTNKGPGLMLKYLEALPASEQARAVKFLFIVPDITKMPKQVWDPHNILAVVPYLILVILFGVSVWLPQWLMPGEKQQKMIGAYMGVMFLYFGWVSPAGVLLYWVTSSAWGLAQQLVTTKMMSSSTQPGSEASAGKPGSGGAKTDLPAGETDSQAPAPSRAKSKKRKK
jgi:YidC/Oxa1 family membrane protein insertase